MEFIITRIASFCLTVYGTGGPAGLGYGKGGPKGVRLVSGQVI